MDAKEDKQFFERLQKHPRLQKRFTEILNIAENTSGELITADEAESKAIEEVRKLGRDVLQEWADNRHAEQINEFEKKHSARKHVKKNSIGKQHLDD